MAKIDDYISHQKPWQQEVLLELRSLIHEVEPNIQEVIKWGTPGFEVKSLVFWTFCAHEWVHFSFVQGALLDNESKLWDETTKESKQKMNRTLKFRKGDSLEAKELKRLMAIAVQNDKEGKKVPVKRTAAGSKVFDIPPDFAEFLKGNSLFDTYLDRPYYQQKGWYEWIHQAKTEATIHKRQKLMLRELETGQYMPSKADRK